MGLSQRVTEILEKIFNKNDRSLNTTILDSTGRTGMNTIFGEQIVAKRISDVSGQFMYGVDLRFAKDPSSNGGTVGIGNALLDIHSGTDVAGNAVIQSLETIRYLPACEAFMFVTTIFDTPKENNDQRAGLFEDNNGIFVGYKGTTFGFTRLRAGVHHFTPYTEFDLDIIGGNNKYNFTLNPQKGNVWKLSFGYLGFANLMLEVLLPSGEWVLVHKIEYPNKYTESNIANTYLPLRGQSVNYGNDTDVNLKLGSVTGGIASTVESKGTEGRRFSFTVPPTATATNTNLITYRIKENFFGIENFIATLLERISISTEGAQTVTLQVIKNMELTGTLVWTDINTTSSTIEYNTNGVPVIGTGEQIIAFELNKNQDYIEYLQTLNLKVYPDQTITFLVNGNNNVKKSLNWLELF
jgi:hypothetical protein